jgi:hypothetical protein
MVQDLWGQDLEVPDLMVLLLVVQGLLLSDLVVQRRNLGKFDSIFLKKDTNLFLNRHL